MKDINFELIKRDGGLLHFGKESIWLKEIIKKDSDKVLEPMGDKEVDEIISTFYQELVLLSESLGRTRFENEEWRACISKAMVYYPEVLNAFLFAHVEEDADIYEQICSKMKDIIIDGDRSNGSIDSSLASSKRALIVDTVEKVTYINYHLMPEQKEALNDGYIYVHDMGHRRDTINCCLFDMENVLSGGFEMGEIWFNEPNSLREAFDAIANVSINAAAQIYGGFTIAQIDELLGKYAHRSFNIYISEYNDLGIDVQRASSLADKKIEKDFENGFRSLEYTFNSLISPRGDYPFITISFGIGVDKYAQMATSAAFKVRKEGHGKDGFKRPVLFPKLVFLYDKALHDDGKELNHLFKEAITCSAKVMYPEYLSLTGEKGIVSRVYKKYGRVISPMCCRAFLSEWYEKVQLINVNR